MSPVELDAALRGFCRRRKFRPFLIEMVSGSKVLVPHPEAVDSKASLYFLRRPDAGYVMFAAESVCGLLDLPPNAAG